MAFIQCTKKLLDEIPPTEEIDHKPTLLGNWHANMIRIERRKCVLFTNDETLYSLFVPMLKKPQFQNLTAVFMENLISTLKHEELDQYVAQIVSEYENNLAITKSSSRSILGYMNDFVNSLYFAIARQGGIENVNILETNHWINKSMVLVKMPFFNPEEGLKLKLEEARRDSS
jgi:hypothetical protein